MKLKEAWKDSPQQVMRKMGEPPLDPPEPNLPEPEDDDFIFSKISAKVDGKTVEYKNLVTDYDASLLNLKEPMSAHSFGGKDEKWVVEVHVDGKKIDPEKDEWYLAHEDEIIKKMKFEIGEEITKRMVDKKRD